MNIFHKKIYVFHFFSIYQILILSTTQVSAQDKSSVARTIKPCRSVFHRPGNCVSLRDCEPLYKLVKEYPFLKRPVILASLCSTNKRNVKVCCPRYQSEDNTGSGEEHNSTTPDGISERPCQPPASNGLLMPPQCGFSNAPHNKVVGGNPSAIGAWPWLAALGYGISPKYVIFQCGGSLISSRYVLTAAHCVQGLQLQVVRLGAHKINSNDPDPGEPMDVLIEKKIVHPNFKLETLENDIAILKLDKDVKFTDAIHPICLPVSDDLRNQTFLNKFPFIAGWGASSNGGPTSETIREVQVPVIDNEECKKDYSEIKNTVIDDRVLCAGYAQGGKDACQGDSGGPLMYPWQTTWYQIGIVSGGYRCGEAGYPGIYTRVTQFLQFIESNLN